MGGIDYTVVVKSIADKGFAGELSEDPAYQRLVFVVDRQAQVRPM